MRQIIIITLLVLAILVSACVPGRAPDKETSLLTQYRTGTQGLVLRFAPNMPPNRLFDTEPFGALIEIENRGAYSVGGPGDRIYLSGFDPSIITGILEWGVEIPYVEGKTQFVTQGGMDVVVLKGNVAPLRPKNIDKFALSFIIDKYDFSIIRSAA